VRLELQDVVSRARAARSGRAVWCFMLVEMLVDLFSIFDSRFSIGRCRAKCEMER